MMKSLYSGVAGLKVHNQRMDVIGNNISNVNTTAFKASTVTFKDIFYQNKSRSSSGDLLSGGTNANQIGYGAVMGSIGQLMVQSGLTYSDRVTDCAIKGEGFFQVMDQVGNIYYTRAGVFHIDNYGNLCDPGGNIVLGVSGDPTGVGASSQRINLYVPPIDDKAASVTKSFRIGNDIYEFTVSASTYGEDGNLSLQFVNGEIPFAVQNGDSITITMDLNQDFGAYYYTEGPGGVQTIVPEGTAGALKAYSAEKAAQDFEDAVYNAILAGGITLAENILPLQFDFVSLPPVLEALTASNTMTYSGEGTVKNTDGSTTTYTADLNLTFTSQAAGDFTNSYEIDIVTNSAATSLKARWDDNVLIITVPSGANVADITLQELQDAIDEAANGNPDRMISVTINNADGTVSTPAANGGVTAISDDTALAISANGVTPKVGLMGGKDNFFRTLAESIGALKLTDGRTAALQTTEDLKEIFIDDDGVIYGVHSVHGTIAMGRIDLVLFENPEGLNQVGTSYWTESLSSGEAVVVTANDYGSGAVVSGALEMSNTDLAQEISDMIITQRGYQANTRVITVSDSMLEELVNLKR